MLRFWAILSVLIVFFIVVVGRTVGQQKEKDFSFVVADAHAIWSALEAYKNASPQNSYPSTREIRDYPTLQKTANLHGGNLTNAETARIRFVSYDAIIEEGGAQTVFRTYVLELSVPTSPNLRVFVTPDKLQVVVNEE